MLCYSVGVGIVECYAMLCYASSSTAQSCSSLLCCVLVAVRPFVLGVRAIMASSTYTVVVVVVRPHTEEGSLYCCCCCYYCLWSRGRLNAVKLQQPFFSYPPAAPTPSRPRRSPLPSTCSGFPTCAWPGSSIWWPQPLPSTVLYNTILQCVYM